MKIGHRLNMSRVEHDTVYDDSMPDELIVMLNEKFWFPIYELNFSFLFFYETRENLNENRQ